MLVLSWDLFSWHCKRVVTFCFFPFYFVMPIKSSPHWQNDTFLMNSGFCNVHDNHFLEYTIELSSGCSCKNFYPQRRKSEFWTTTIYFPLKQRLTGLNQRQKITGITVRLMQMFSIHNFTRVIVRATVTKIPQLPRRPHPQGRDCIPLWITIH